MGDGGWSRSGRKMVRRGRWTARRSARAVKKAPIRMVMAMLAAMKGWWVANQVMPTATTSSVELRAMLEMGSGLGVTAARTAVLEVWAARATAAPMAVVDGG